MSKIDSYTKACGQEAAIVHKWQEAGICCNVPTIFFPKIIFFKKKFVLMCSPQHA